MTPISTEGSKRPLRVFLWVWAITGTMAAVLFASTALFLFLELRQRTPKLYCDTLAAYLPGSVSTLPRLSSKAVKGFAPIFVYGTLKQGFPNHHLLVRPKFVRKFRERWLSQPLGNYRRNPAGAS